MTNLETEHGIFTSNEETGQTADEVYQQWLENKDKPPKLSEIDLLKISQAEQFELILEFIGGM